MFTETDICNMALGLLDEAKITSYTDDTGPVARMCRLHYPILRDTMLRKYRWNFAIARTSLAANSDAPASGWSYSYDLPADCLRLLPVQYESRHGAKAFEHVVERGKILTNVEAPLKIVYIARVDASAFDPLFADALAKALAVRLCNAITGKSSYLDRLTISERDALTAARNIDGMEGTPEPDEDWDFALARWGYDVNGLGSRE